MRKGVLIGVVFTAGLAAGWVLHAGPRRSPLPPAELFPGGSVTIIRAVEPYQKCSVVDVFLVQEPDGRLVSLGPDPGGEKWEVIVPTPAGARHLIGAAKTAAP